MESIINDEKMKELLTQVIVELLQSKREVFYNIVLDALEEVGLANAITEGRNNDFVSEETIFSILDGEQT